MASTQMGTPRSTSAEEAEEAEQAAAPTSAQKMVSVGTDTEDLKQSERQLTLHFSVPPTDALNLRVRNPAVEKPRYFSPSRRAPVFVAVSPNR
jgi:hypothetical protein